MRLDDGTHVCLQLFHQLLLMISENIVTHCSALKGDAQCGLPASLVPLFAARGSSKLYGATLARPFLVQSPELHTGYFASRCCGAAATRAQPLVRLRS